MLKREVLMAVSASMLLSTPALAYRPYDSTDADVVDDDELEIELGWRRADFEGGELNSLRAVFNLGLGRDREIVAEGEWERVHPSEGPSESSIGDVGLFLKQIHRRGSLQGDSGVSIASECGALIPTQHEEAGVGAECLLIASHVNSAVAIHINAGLAYETDHRWARSLGLIVERSGDYRLKPGIELMHERSEGDRSEMAMLVGVTWTVEENCALDVAFRQQLHPSSDLHELRLGLTWTR